MRVLITRHLPETVLERARARFDVTLRDNEAEVPGPEELAAALRDYDAVLCAIGDRYAPEVFALAGPNPRAKLLANFGVGYNHIDVEAARAAGIQVTNTPGAVTDATADIGMSLILMTARRLGEGERLLRGGKWIGWRPVQMLGTHVSGKKVGIIGFGRIGQAVARRCHYGFGMEVVFWNRSEISDPGMPARQVSIEEAMGCDFVVMGLAANAHTRHIINAEKLAMMKPEGIFVNIARGDVVDEQALITALQEGRLAGAGLDVYEFEPQVPEALLGMENVVLLPHLGTASLEIRENMGMMAVENLEAFAEGRALPNPV